MNRWKFAGIKARPLWYSSIVNRVSYRSRWDWSLQPHKYSKFCFYSVAIGGKKKTHISVWAFDTLIVVYVYLPNRTIRIVYTTTSFA